MAEDTLVVWLVTVLTLWLTHWFRWPSELHYCTRYAIGVLCLNLPFAVWLLGRGYDWEILVALGGAVICGGLAVVMAYTWDWALNNYRRRKAVEAANDN